jgi:glyoxylase-like metal-dependent hydrolase (beta-lactamase superfamily II)
MKHLNCGWLHKPPLPRAACHCVVLQTAAGVLLVDAGIGQRDVEDPAGRIGRQVIDEAGFQFCAEDTAIRQLAKCGISPAEVTDIVLTHGDPDHAGGLADFPDAQIHVSHEEKQNIGSGNQRYSAAQFAHGPLWRTYATNDCDTWGQPSRKVAVAGDIDVRLIPLFGHTLGHCGVAVRVDRQWLLHAGDAYYLRDELANDQHPIGAVAAVRADNDEWRRQSLAAIRQLHLAQPPNVSIIGYHDPAELPD